MSAKSAGFGGPMKKGLLIVLAALALGGGFLWWWKGRSATPAAEPTTQNASGATSATMRGEGARADGVQAAELASVVIRVSSAAGPIANAAVRLQPGEGDVMVIATDEDGIARAEQLGAGEWKISASAPGFAPGGLAPRTLVGGEKADLAITLVAGGRLLQGTVSDVSGGPIAGARVDAAKLGGMVRPGDDVATVLTDKDGKYAVSVAEGQLLVAASSPDYAAQARYVEVGANGATADFALVPGAVVEGIVRDAETKKPVAGARVTAGRDGGLRIGLADRSRVQATTGADGTFRFKGLSPGAYELSARTDALTSRAPVVIGVGVAAEITDVEILVSRALRVSGVVHDEEGKPVANINVVAGANGSEGGQEESDENGAFAMFGLPPGHYVMYGRSAAYVAGEYTPIDVTNRDVTGVVVKVRKGRTLTGHVEPRQKCRVSYELDGSAFGARMPTLVAAKDTDANGNFELGPGSNEKATLVARCESGDMGTLAITEASGAGLVVPVEGAGSIAGRLVDTKGQPIGGATVMAAPDGEERRIEIVNGVVVSGVQALTSSTGAFEIKGLAAGTYRLNAMQASRPMRPRPVVNVELAEKEKKKDVQLVVDRADGVIAGVVTGPNGAPLPDAWVSVHLGTDAIVESLFSERKPGQNQSTSVTTSNDGDSGNASEAAPVLTDAAGRFTIPGLVQSKYQVFVEAQGGALRGRAVDVVPDAQLAIKASAVTSLSGTVRSANGPASVFDVEITGPTVAKRTFTDGVFEIGRVDPGAYQVRVSSPAGNAEMAIEIRPGEAKTIDMVLVANAVVTGQVVDADGKPLIEVGVVVVKDDGDGRTSITLNGPPPMTGPDGKFRVEAPARASVVVVMTQPEPVVRRGVSLVAGQTFDLGVIRAEPGAPPPK